MSTFQIPPYVLPVLEFYEISWPDVDEDKVNQVGLQIQRIGGHALIFGIVVKNALNGLAEASSCAALDEMAAAWSSVVRDQLQPMSDLSDHAPEITVAAANAITAYKAALLAALTLQIGSDALSAGVSAVVKKTVAREAIHQAMHAVAHEVGAAIASVAKEQFEALVITPVKALIDEVIKAATHDLKRIVVSAVPTFDVSLGESMLYIEFETVESAVSKIAAAYETLATSVKELVHVQLGESFAEPTPMPDMTVRTEVKEVMDYVAKELEAQLDDLGKQVVDKLAESIRDVYLKFQEADADLSTVAARLQQQFAASSYVPPSLLDGPAAVRSIDIDLAGTPMHTGAATSNAGAAAASVEWQTAGEPVLTGLGQSAAGAAVRDIEWERAGAPVTTGSATAGASSDGGQPSEDAADAASA